MCTELKYTVNGGREYLWAGEKKFFQLSFVLLVYTSFKFMRSLTARFKYVVSLLQ